MFGVWGKFSDLGIWICAGICFAAAGCSQSSSEPFDAESVLTPSCQVSQDQRQSFMAKVSPFPLQLNADAAFTDNERAGIESAVTQWNGLGQQLIGQNFFNLQYTQLASSFHSADPRDCSVDSFGSSQVFSIVRENSATRWQNMGFSNSIPGATIRCFSGKQVSHQVVMVFINIIDPMQFSSVFLHELGHSLGLDHSCTGGAGSEKFISCMGLPEYHPYHLAVMFPSLRARRTPIEDPEIKDSLRDNDILRTQCLYRTAP